MVDAIGTNAATFQSVRLDTTSTTTGSTTATATGSTSTDSISSWGDTCCSLPQKMWEGVTYVASTLWSAITCPFRSLCNAIFGSESSRIAKSTDQLIAHLQAEMTADNVSAADLMKHFVTLVNLPVGDKDDAVKVNEAIKAAAKAVHDKGGAVVEALKGAIYNAALVANGGNDPSNGDVNYGGTLMMNDPTGAHVKSAAETLYHGIPTVAMSFAKDEIAAKGTTDPKAAVKAFATLAQTGASALEPAVTNEMLNDAKRVAFFTLPEGHRNGILGVARTAGLTAAMLGNDAANNGNFGNVGFGGAAQRYFDNTFPAA